MERKNIGAISMKGGRKDQFFFCHIEYFPDSNRWFLKSLLQVKDEEGLEGDEAIKAWLNQYQLKQLVLDIPLSLPLCQSCVPGCQGQTQCPRPEIKAVREQMNTMLAMDRELEDNDPKAYEWKRNAHDQFDHQRDMLAKRPDEHLLSRSFKRRLKKGFLPYWNRPLDLWVWSEYYDYLLDIFNVSFDSFGNISMMTLFRFEYLKRHFTSGVELYEGNNFIILLELLKAGIISKLDLQLLGDLEQGAQTRVNILKKIEQHLGIFIYHGDMQTLCQKPRAFDSFLLAVAGQNAHMGQQVKLPHWTMPEDVRFVVPKFARAHAKKNT